MLSWIRAWRRRGNRVSLVRTTPRATAGQRDADQALSRAEEACTAVREQGEEVSTLTASLRSERTSNHFAERLRLTVEGGR
jgi:hypothetical protein